MKARPIFVLATLAILLTAPSIPAEILYNIIDLGTGTAHSINNNGLVVGRNAQAILFDFTGWGNNIHLGALGGGFSCATSINDNGQIVGWAFTASSLPHATLFDPSGGGNNIDLDTLGSYNSAAWSINNSGQIVGYISTASGFWLPRATLFDPTGQGDNIGLHTLPGYNGSSALSINDSSQIVGYALTESGVTRATLFDSAGLGNNVDLGRLSGWTQYVNSVAYSINNTGQIVGDVHVTSPDPFAQVFGCRAVLFEPTGGGNNIDLGTLGGLGSRAYSINNKGQIVGYAGFCSGGRCGQRATLFDPTGNGNNIDLNNLIDPNLGWILMEAVSINDKGWITGYGRKTSSSVKYVFLLTAFTEPPIEAEIDIDPNTLNLKSKGKWITCHIRLGEDYNVVDVNSYSVFLEDEIKAEWIWVDEPEQVLMAKFSRADLCQMLAELDELGDVELSVSGELLDGARFEGTDAIKVIDKGRKK